MINFVQGSLLCPLTFDISNFWSRRLASAINGVVSGFCSCSEFQYFSSVLSPSVLVLCQVLSRGFNVLISVSTFLAFWLVLQL